MFGSFTDHDRAVLHAIAHALNLTIKLEMKIMTTEAEVKAQSDAILAKARAESDALTAIAGAFDSFKAQVSDLQNQLAAAIASQADQATLQAISDNLKAANDALDANAVAEAALTGTSAAPAPSPEPTPADAPTADQPPVDNPAPTA